MFLPIFVLSSFVTAGSCMFFENLSPKARCRSIFLGSKWEWLPIFFVPLQSNYDKSISSSTHAGRTVRHPAPRPCLALLLLVRHVAHGCAWRAACSRGRAGHRPWHPYRLCPRRRPTDHAEWQDRVPTGTGHPIADYHGTSPYAPPPAHGQLCDGGAWRPQHQYLHPGERSLVCRGSRQACLSCQEHLQRKRNRILILKTYKKQ